MPVSPQTDAVRIKLLFGLDGDIDAFISIAGASNQLLRNDGNGTFTPAVNGFPEIDHAFSVKLGDFSGDRQDDVLLRKSDGDWRVYQMYGLVIENQARVRRSRPPIGCRLD